MEASNNACRVSETLNPHFVRITLGIVAILAFRTTFLKSLAVGFAHFSVQGLLIALAGDAPATGAPRLPLALQLVFFPITILPEKHGILVPFGPFLNSGFVGLVFLLAFRALNRGANNPGEPDAARPSTTFVHDGLNALLSLALSRFAKGVQARGGLPDSWRGLMNNVTDGSVKVGDTKRSVANWMDSVQASTTEIQSTQDGARYWVSAAQMLWGMWTVTVAAQGLFGTKKMVYSLCLVTPELMAKFGDPLLKAALDGGRVKWVPVSSFAEEDGKTLRLLAANVVQVAPRTQWDSLIKRELHTRFSEIVPANNA